MKLSRQSGVVREKGDQGMNKITNHLPTSELQAIDAAHHMHPFSSGDELRKKGVRVITRAKGVFLTDSEGNDYEANELAIFEREQDARFSADAWQNRIEEHLDQVSAEYVTTDMLMEEALGLRE